MEQHRVRAVEPSDVLIGEVRYAPLKSMWFFCMAGPLGLLRQHELRDYAQRLPDCHPYLRHGRSIWVDAWWQLHCDLHFSHPPAVHIEARLADDRFYRFLERTWMLQQVPVALLLFYLGGWPFVVFGSCARVTAGVFGHWLIGYFAHNHGEMAYVVQGAAVQGRNLRLTSLLTMGECWHNNHHAFPGSARLGLKSGEWDPGWWALVALQRCGLVWGIVLPADLAVRPELLQLAETTGNFSYESEVVGARGGCVEGTRALMNSGLPTDRKGTTP